MLIFGCNSTHAKSKIIYKGGGIALNEVIEILWVEDSTSKTLQNIDSTKSMHYAKYDKKKSESKGGKPKQTGSVSLSSSSQNSNSTGGSKVYYCCCM